MTCVTYGDENRDYGTISDEQSEEVVLESSPALGTYIKIFSLDIKLVFIVFTSYFKYATVLMKSTFC